LSLDGARLTRYTWPVSGGDAGGVRVVLVDDRLLGLEGAGRLLEAGFDVVGGPLGWALDPELADQQRLALLALSPREHTVMAMMAEGRSNGAICDRLGLCSKTIEGHVHGIFLKLGLARSADDHRRVLAVLVYLLHTARPR
jgi:DNA-binding CsgD family transcriptional regulator